MTGEWVGGWAVSLGAASRDVGRLRAADAERRQYVPSAFGAAGSQGAAGKAAKR